MTIVVNESIISEAQEVLGVPKPVSKPPVRIPITKFRHGNIFVGLNMVADYDKKKQDYKALQPRMTFIVGDMHPYLPVDAQLFKDLGRSFTDLGNSIEDMEFPQDEWTSRRSERSSEHWGVRSMNLEDKCCLTCSYYPCPKSKGELDGPCEEYDPLDFDQGNVEYSDDVIIRLHGLEALREFYSDEEMEEYFGHLIVDRDESIELDRRGLLDDSDRKLGEEVFGPVDWPSKHLNVEGNVKDRES